MVTSTPALPMPTTAAASSATTYSGSRPISAIGAPHRTTEIDSHRVIARLPTSRVQAMLPTSAPTPTAPCRTPTLGLAPLQQVDGHDDDEHGEGTAKEALQHHEEEDDHDALAVRHWPEALADLADQPPLARGRGHPLVPETDDEERRHDAARTGEHEDRGDVGHGNQHGRDERADHDAERVEQPAYDVDRRQLCRASCTAAASGPSGWHGTA